MSVGSSSATGHAHAQQPQQQEDQEDLFPPDNFSMVDAGIYRSESRSRYGPSTPLVWRALVFQIAEKAVDDGYVYGTWRSLPAPDGDREGDSTNESYTDDT